MKVTVMKYNRETQEEVQTERQAGKDKSVIMAFSTWSGSFRGVEIAQGSYFVFRPWLSGFSDEAAREAIGAHPDALVDSSGVNSDAQGYID